MTKDQTLPTEPKAQTRLNHYCDDLKDILATEVTVSADGKEIVVTKQKAILMKIVSDAMAGQPKPSQLVLEYLKLCPIPPAIEFRMTSTARKMLDIFVKDAEATEYDESALSENPSYSFTAK